MGDHSNVVFCFIYTSLVVNQGQRLVQFMHNENPYTSVLMVINFFSTLFRTHQKNTDITVIRQGNGHLILHIGHLG